MMKATRTLLRLVVLGGVTFTALSLSVLSAQPQVTIDTLSDFRKLPRTSHPACLECFTIAKEGSYDIFEEVPGTGAIIKRNLPNPAPLEPDEQRLEFDPDTGLPIWYIGQQPYVGPTDLEPWSSRYPRPLIELKRIHARHQDKIFSIPGVHSFGIGENGFVVSLLPKHSGNMVLIPKTIENVPVEVTIEEVARAQSHANTKYAPVPVGSGIESARGFGTLGPHIVRSAGEVRIHSLTATHVIKFVDQPHIGNLVRQPRFGAPGSRAWGTAIHSFQMTPCDIPTDPNCNRSGVPINNTWVVPDVAAIQNFTAADSFPHTAPGNTDEPIRRLQYGPTSHVNGPSGIIVSPSYGASAKMWGANSDAPVGTIRNLVMRVFDYPSVTGVTRKFKMQGLCEVIYERNTQAGDSGALVAGNGSSNRHVYGIHIGGPGSGGVGYHVPAGDIYTAFSNSNFSFSHYWGTASGRSDLWFPANTQCNGSC